MININPTPPHMGAGSGFMQDNSVASHSFVVDTWMLTPYKPVEMCFMTQNKYKHMYDTHLQGIINNIYDF